MRRLLGGATGRVKAGRIAAGLAALLMGLSAGPARGQTELLGPLRIRDTTPFNLLRLEMLPAHAVAAAPGSWAIEADLLYSNTFVMSPNVQQYLQARGVRGPLSQADANGILALGQEAYYLDGEVGLLDLTIHYAVARGTSVYVTLTGYQFNGGFLDGTIEGFHGTFGLGTDGRDLVSRGVFQGVVAVGGVKAAYLAPPVERGFGDPVVGARHAWGLGTSRWVMVLDGAAKIAWQGEREFLSTGENDYGVQTSLQGKFERQAVYLGASAVSADGRVMGVELPRTVIPTLTAAYEVGVTDRTSVIMQTYASRSTVRDTTIEELKADKYEASFGFRTVRGRLVYGLAVTENVENFANTPDLGVSLNLAWIVRRP